jgi:hypothetical protein
MIRHFFYFDFFPASRAPGGRPYESTTMQHHDEAREKGCAAAEETGLLRV